LLYAGPWLAERLHATEDLLRREPEALLPITRAIIEGGRRYDALAAFRATYRLAELRRTVEPLWQAVDALVLPTAGTIYAIEAVSRDPLELNANLGRYTNFVNLLDLAALAVPTGFRGDGMPFGVSLIGPAGADRALAALGIRLQARLRLPLGAAGMPSQTA
jgi:allophanate hydrolase